MANVAFLFPGQGAQAVGMGKAFYDRFDEAKDIYHRANAKLGYDVTAMCFEGPADTLTKTETCQPALFTTSLAAYASLQRALPSARPLAAAGLSLGELSALAAAQVFSLEDGWYLVRARAEAMAECAAKHPGAMLAVIGLEAPAIEDICRGSGALGANYNAPDQVVLSGSAESIAKAKELADAAGAKRAIKLEVSGAFHSPFMQPAAEVFKAALANVAFRQPAFPVVSNVTAKASADPEEIRRLLVQQITSPVRWDQSVRAMIQAGATQFLELPPARVLTALLRRIDTSVKGAAIDTPQDLDKAAGLLQAAA
jgi:[acyl-carrier-protein] S-malonyltransferase